MKLSQPMKGIVFAFGCVSLVLGVVGIFVPLLPTTPFILLSGWCFLRSSERFHSWLVSHERFGPMLIAWRDHGAIPVGAKKLALFTILSSLLVIWFFVPSLDLRIGVTALLTAVSLYVFTRPNDGNH